MDGEPWAATPSIGCDEVWESDFVGPLSAGINPGSTVVAERGRVILSGQLTGRAARVGWDFGDGSALTNVSLMSLERGR